MEFAILSIPGLVSNPIGGAWVTLDNGKYRDMQIWCGAVMLAGSAMFVLARMTVSGLRIRMTVSGVKIRAVV